MESKNDQPNRRVSQADVAQAIGVNASTVSRALRGDPRITKKVREKVLRAVRELGYRPDPAVSALANYRWKNTPREFAGVVAWITVGDEPKSFRAKYPEFELYWKGASTCAERFGYRIDEFSVSDETSLSKLEKVLHARNVSGLLLPPEIEDFPTWQKLEADNYSIVRLSRTVHNLEAHLVTTNQTADGILAARSMWDLGYRRIGFAGGKKIDRLFSPGFQWGWRNQQDVELIPPLFFDDIAPDERANALAEWIRVYEPDAILEDWADFYDLLDRSGLRIPEDIHVATQNAFRNPGKAGIMQNLEEVGRVAMLLLLSLISDHDHGIPEIARQVLVKGRWVHGDSLPGVPGNI